MPAVAWVLFVALGFLLLKNMPKRRKGDGGGGGGGYYRSGGGGGTAVMDRMMARVRAALDAVMIRAAAISFVLAGMISAGGVVGAAISWIVSVTGAIGAGVIWVAWIVCAFLWVIGLFPEKIFPGDVPDWLSLCGVILPTLLASVPGPIGDTVMRALVNLHNAIGPWVTSGFGIKA